MNVLGRKRPRRALLGLFAVAATISASLGMAVSAGAAAEGVVVAEGGPTSISGSYIVVLKDGVTTQSVEGQASGLATRFGGQVTRTYSSALRGFAVSMGARQARRLAADPAVARVEQDQTATVSGVQSPTPSWGLDRIDQHYLPLNNSYTYPNTASNVHAYIIDTGILISHTDFGGRASVGTGDNQASFSNYGTCLALYAPGVSIISDWNTSSTATNTISGTSAASPHVAGAAALYLSANPSSSAAQVRAALVGKATSGVVKTPGPGSPNKLLFVS